MKALVRSHLEGRPSERKGAKCNAMRGHWGQGRVIPTLLSISLYLSKEITGSLRRCFSVWFLFYLLIYLLVHSISYDEKLLTAKKQKGSEARVCL